LLHDAFLIISYELSLLIVTSAIGFALRVPGRKHVAGGQLRQLGATTRGCDGRDGARLVSFHHWRNGHAALVAKTRR
jgi:hypothetical protein